MGVVTVPSSASRTTTGPFRFSRRSGSTARPLAVVAFKTDRTVKCSVKSQDSTTVPVLDQPKEVPQKARPRARSRKNQPKRANLEADLDYNEVAAALENIYKLSPGADVAEVGLQGKKKGNVVRSRKRKGKGRRLRLDERVAMKERERGDDNEEEEERLVREYSGWSDLGTLDWKRVKIPPVLRSSEQARLFKLMQPMKVILNDYHTKD